MCNQSFIPGSNVSLGVLPRGMANYGCSAIGESQHSVSVMVNNTLLACLCFSLCLSWFVEGRMLLCSCSKKTDVTQQKVAVTDCRLHVGACGGQRLRGKRSLQNLGFRWVQVGWQWKGTCCFVLQSSGDFQRTRERRGGCARRGLLGKS